MSDSRTVRLKSVAWFFWAKYAALFIFLIVVALLIFTPTYIDGPRQNESTAVGRLRTVNMLETQYSLAHPSEGFGCELSRLRPVQEVNDTHDPLAEFLTGDWSGYRFEVVGCRAEANGIVTRYQVTAVPVKRGETGNRAFCTDQSGKVFYDPDGSALNCIASRRPI
jgi:type IV pilus assembly protein PilA